MPTSSKGSPAVDVGSMNRHKCETKKLEKKSLEPILSIEVLPLWSLELMWEYGGEPAQVCFANAPPVSPLLAIRIVLGWRYALTQTLTTTFIRSRKIKSLIMTWHSIKAIPLHLFWTFSCKSWHIFWYWLKTERRWQFTKLHCMWIFSGFDKCTYSI